MELGQQLAPGFPGLGIGCVQSWAKPDGAKGTRRGRSTGQAPGKVLSRFLKLQSSSIFQVGRLREESELSVQPLSGPNRIPEVRRSMEINKIASTTRIQLVPCDKFCRKRHTCELDHHKFKSCYCTTKAILPTSVWP